MNEALSERLAMEMRAWLLRHWKLLALGLALGTLIGGFANRQRTPMYQATAAVETPSTAIAATVMQLAQMQQLPSTVQVLAAPTGNLVRVTATATSQDAAIQQANQYADQVALLEPTQRLLTHPANFARLANSTRVGLVTDIGLGALVGLLISALLAWGVEEHQHRARQQTSPNRTQARDLPAEAPTRIPAQLNEQEGDETWPRRELARLHA